jgi:hypothetical protein
MGSVWDLGSGGRNKEQSQPEQDTRIVSHGSRGCANILLASTSCLISPVDLPGIRYVAMRFNISPRRNKLVALFPWFEIPFHYTLYKNI